MYQFIVFLAVFLVLALIFKSRHILHTYQDWRHGQEVDETAEWQEFQAAFEVKK